MDLEQEVRAGGKAQEILSNEVFRGAVRALEEALLLGIRQSAFKDAELREKLCHRYALLQDLVGQIQTVMETGQMAEQQIRELTLAEKMKKALHIS